MDATNGENATINFFCATCGEILRGLASNGIACSSCVSGIPIPTNEHENSSNLPHPEEEIFKFFCSHCEQKFSSPVGFAGKRFNCPMCSKENVVPDRHSGSLTQENPPAIPSPRPGIGQDVSLPEFELEPSSANPASGQLEQLPLLNETDPAAPRRKNLIKDESPVISSPGEIDQAALQEQDPCHKKPNAKEIEPAEIQPIRITHPVNGEDRTILPRRRAKEESNELIPIRLGDEDTALPAPKVKQPNPIPRKVSDFLADSDREGDSIDPLFGDEIEIEKIFPVTNTQV